MQSSHIALGAIIVGLYASIHKLHMRSPSRDIQLTLLHDLNFIHQGVPMSPQSLLTFLFSGSLSSRPMASAMIHAIIHVIIKLIISSTSIIPLSMHLYLQILNTLCMQMEKGAIS